MTTIAPVPVASSTSPHTAASDIDERTVARRALEAAETELRDLCSAHAGAFVAAERRGRETASRLGSLTAALDHAAPAAAAAREDAVGTSEGCAAVALAASAERHRLRRRTLSQHSSLLELLELPSLMDACVRSPEDLCDEALDVAAFANALERRHCGGGKGRSEGAARVVADVVAGVRRREADLRRGLLRRLRDGDVGMAECLDAVTALRRLNGVAAERVDPREAARTHAAAETGLRVDFLEARDAWLEDAVDRRDVRDDDGGAALADDVERYRTRCFEIATQYAAVFGADDRSDDDASSVSLLSMWTTRRVQSFLSSLSRRLAAVDDCAVLRDALDAAVFFAASMGRVGADFRALLPPVFAPRLVVIVRRRWEAGRDRLARTLRVCREAGVAGPLAAQDDDRQVVVDVVVASGVGPDDAPPPPRALAILPALAALSNDVSRGLNEARRCLLVAALPDLRRTLRAVLDESRTMLEANERAVKVPGFAGEATKLRDAARRMRVAFEETVAPYCTMALDVAFGAPVPDEWRGGGGEKQEKQEQEEEAEEKTEDPGTDKETKEEEKEAEEEDRPEDIEAPLEEEEEEKNSVGTADKSQS